MNYFISIGLTANDCYRIDPNKLARFCQVATAALRADYGGGVHVFSTRDLSARKMVAIERDKPLSRREHDRIANDIVEKLTNLSVDFINKKIK